MKKSWNFFSVTLAAGLVPLMAVAASSPEPEAEIAAPEPVKPQIVAPNREVRRLFDLDLRRWPEERFYENLTAQIKELSTSHGPEIPMVLMDTAELYLGQMMVYEAGSVLQGLTVEPAQEQRLKALQHAHGLLTGVAVEEFEQSPLAAETRPDHAFWTALQAIATADADLLRANLDRGLVGLMHQSRPVAHTALPILTEAIIEAGEDALAVQALRLLNEFPDLTNKPVGYYLRGRAAQVQDNDSTALTEYFEAAKGWDRYAVRGRLALAGMALEDGGRGALLAAQDVLEHGLSAWRGDRLEMATLEALAEVYTASNESMDALTIHGQIMLRFPGTPSAERAEKLAEVELAKVYERGEAQEIPLSRWLAVHYKLVPSFRYYSQFPDFVERLGDYLLAAGGTTMAVTEYKRALDLQTDMQIVFPGTFDPDAYFRVQVKLANAYASGGQYITARELLMDLDVPDDIEAREDLNKLKATVLSELGDDQGLLRTHIANPTAANLRQIGQALWSNQDWVDAAIFYSRLWAEYPGQFDVDDATYLLIASHRSGDQEKAQRVVEAFPGLTESEGWLRIAESLLATPAEVMPLNRNGADSRLSSLDDALTNLKDSGL